MLRLHLIDVSAKALDEASHALATLDDAEIVTHQTTYESGLIEVARPGARTLVLFLGSTIGNFDRPAGIRFLQEVRGILDRTQDRVRGILTAKKAVLISAAAVPLALVLRRIKLGAGAAMAH